MQMLGHDGPPTAFWSENLITEAPLQRCPVRTLQLARETSSALADEVDRYADTYYPAYEDGHLLAKGGVADQPARYLALISAIRSMDARVQIKAAELAKKEAGGQ